MPSKSPTRAPSGTRAERQFQLEQDQVAVTARLAEQPGVDDRQAVTGRFDIREQRQQFGHAARGTVVEERHEQLLFRREVRIEGALRVPGGRGDVVDRRAVESVAGDEAACRLQQARPRDLLALAAVRQAPLRRLLAERYAATRAQVAALLADGLAEADAAALPVDALAAVIVAVTDGLPLQGLVDPDAVPETAFSDAVARMLGLADDDREGPT